MSFLSWLRNRNRSHASQRRRIHSVPQKPAGFRPRLEVLEGRDVPSTLMVTNTLDDGPGSLRADIAAAKNNDTIVFAPSLHGQTITLVTGDLDVTRNLTIQGPGAGQLTISGGFTSRVFDVAAKTKVVLSGLTISHGNGSDLLVEPGLNFYDRGGAILNHGNLTVADCTFFSNSADYAGGGIYNDGTMTVTGCTFSLNRLSGWYAIGGGGIYSVGTDAQLTVSNSFFSGNPPGDIYGQYTDGGGNSLL
jgi:predicted outer membrane repeat protein